MPCGCWSPRTCSVAGVSRPEQPGPASAELATFAASYPFGLDPFQLDACRALADGRGVLVAAPTGAGKTVVGEFAAHLALARGRKCFYTTPIKALSNQKYADLVRRHGPERVGLLTGDNSINGTAPVVVMTTEVLRNMIYAGSAMLDGLGFVVMDEVHYLADRTRGAVWEEVIIHLAPHVQVVSLSATVSNAEEFGDWLVAVRGDTAVIVSEHRPVPLLQHVMVDDRLLDLFVRPPGAARDRVEVNPELVALARDSRNRDTPGERGLRRGQRRAPGGPRPPSRAEVVRRLATVGLLPGIVFIFSRAGADSAVEQCMRTGIRLTSPAERDRIRGIVSARCAELAVEDLAVLGYHGWRDALERGVAAHHAGMLPTFKEVVEELFAVGLVKVVFATETLALGINMPARSVVIERLVKWNGLTHAEVTPGEYTQLTGRAGRRGIDVEGHAVVPWSPDLDPMALGGLASARTYPLRSSFRPSYTMAVSLVDRLGRQRSRAVLQTSFAQFQADRAVLDLTRQAQRNEEALSRCAEAMSCHLGDFAAYAGLRQQLGERLAALPRPTPAPERGRAVAPADTRGRRRRGGGDGRGGVDPQVARLRSLLRAHPCHRCPQREQHARWAKRWWQLRRDTDALARRVANRTHSIARTFDRVCQVLDELGYLQGDAVTPAGRRLTLLHGELDLLAAQCLREGVWEGLEPADLAGCVSALVHEPRQAEEVAVAPPVGAVRDRLAAMTRLWSRLEALEREAGLDFLREPSFGFVRPAQLWATGATLETVLGESELAAGDFVRTCKQVIDSLGQVGEAAHGTRVAQTARRAREAMLRGVVAYSSVG